MGTPPPGGPPASAGRPSPSLGRRFILAGILSLLAWGLLQSLAPGAAIPGTPAMEEASGRMAEALEVLAGRCAEAGIRIDPALDPAGTCLIGPEHTPLFTSLGQLEAKRTSVAPDLAALLVHLLGEAGVGGGDAVAIGASGSFPGLLVASLVAVETLEARPVAILSLGASSYGATRPDFHLLDLHRALLHGGVVATPPDAVSLGGEGDVGEGFEATFLEALRAELATGETPFLEEPDLGRNVAARMGIYGPVSAFINIGGAEANLGTHARILSVPPGLSLDLASRLDPPSPDQRGVLFEMAARGVPVIHLLNLRGLALRYGVPWDPIPLPAPGSVELRDATRGKGWVFWLLTVGYVASLALVAFVGRRDPASREPLSTPS